jgi:hypothetical protein
MRFAVDDPRAFVAAARERLSGRRAAQPVAGAR